MTDVEQIAKSLTKAQRAFLAEDRHNFASGYKPGERLVALGLLDRKKTTFGQSSKLTPLGIAVRAHLSESQS